MRQNGTVNGLASADDYAAFIRSKIKLAGDGAGFQIVDSDLHPSARPHQRDAIKWACRLGRALLGMAFGLGKTHVQIEVARLVVEHAGGRFLIVAPLGVKHVFTEEEGPRLGVRIQYVRNDAEVLAADTNILISNYERVRDGDISPYLFVGVSLDEGSVLRTLGTKTTRRFISAFKGLQYRFVATATPAPNRFLELIHYADFLGVMDEGQARTRWFKRNSSKAHDLELLPNQEREFWLWVASWGLFLNKPSDLGYDDTGYELPPLEVHWHRIEVDHTRAWEQVTRDGQHRLFLNGAAGVVEAATEKRETMDDRIAKMAEIVAAHPDDHWLLWHHLEPERKAVCRAIPEAVAVFGSQPLELKEGLILQFGRGQFPILATKPEIAGAGCNFQNYCHRAIFLGVNYKFEEFIQAIHRIHRYGQEHKVELHIIHAASEDGVVEALQRKWERHNYLVAEMQAIMKHYGLSQEAMRQSLSRSIGVTRRETRGEFFKAVNNDCVIEVRGVADNSAGLIMTSIPFGDQYEYVADYHDFGHNESNEEFFRQMDFLVPHLHRVLKPGRIAAIHCKDRVRVGKYSEHGVFSVDPFSDDVTRAFTRHGFIYIGRVIITSDVVRENNQTYRLGWSEMVKDGSKMGVGMPEYIQLFRRLPTDTSNARADEPVTKDKADYSLGRWQIDAHSYWRSNGNRLLDPDEMAAYDLRQVAAMVKAEQLNGSPYDHERHAEICEALERRQKLPKTFMLLPPQSNNEFVWTDIVQARTLNSTQAQNRLQQHVCPLPLDIVKRAITRWSNPGDVVFDPFAGLFSVPYEAIRLGRIGFGIELSADYYDQGVKYCQEAEQRRRTPTLFDLLAVTENEAPVEEEVI
ncbi:MAG: DNA methylase N-4 [Chloroflexi bacterium]|nr:DNA methylase N-4 [Chloroflexota bacterium]